MSTARELSDYVYRGARAMVLMHEQYQREFLAVWRQAKAAGITLPKTEDPDYQSLEHLLVHLLRSSRGYLTWICEKLELPDPGIDLPPSVEQVERDAAAYLEHVLACWRKPLAPIDEARMSFPSYKSRWDMDYSIDSMLEHALVHPLRHTFQLRELLAAAQ
jgi:uncharacterized damage-inducible protein DinB